MDGTFGRLRQIVDGTNRRPQEWNFFGDVFLRELERRRERFLPQRFQLGEIRGRDRS